MVSAGDLSCQNYHATGVVVDAQFAECSMITCLHGTGTWTAWPGLMKYTIKMLRTAGKTDNCFTNMHWEADLWPSPTTQTWPPA